MGRTAIVLSLSGATLRSRRGYSRNPNRRMWDQKVRQLTEESFRRRPQSPLRRSRARFRNGSPAVEAVRIEPTDYTGIGADLRAEREDQGRSLPDVAAALHIQQHYLEAIEAGRFDALPGSTYVTGFLRSYSRYLGINAGDVVAAFRQETTMPLGPTKLVEPEPVAEPRRPRATVVLVSLLAVAVLYAGWSYLDNPDVAVSEVVAPAPERLLSLLRADTAPIQPAPARAGSEIGAFPAAPEVGLARAGAQQRMVMALGDAAATAREVQRDADAVLDPTELRPTGPSTMAPPAAAEVSLPAPAAPAAESEEPSQISEDTPPETPALETVDLKPPPPPVTQPPQEVAESAPTLPPPPPSVGGGNDYVPQRFGGGGDDARIVIRAKVDSWVQIQGARNETLLTRILRPGDTFYAPNRGDLMLTTGNVGGLDIIVDGEALAPLGPMGAVRRNISLDAEKLLALANGDGRRR